MRRWESFAVVACGLLAGCTTKVIVVVPTITAPSKPPVSASVIASCRADAKSVETAVEAYKAQVGGNPPPSISALTQTADVGGQTVGPWLQAVPTSSHYTILLDTQGNVYVYPPMTDASTQLDHQHSFDLADPCATFATY